MLVATGLFAILLLSTSITGQTVVEEGATAEPEPEPAAEGKPGAAKVPVPLSKEWYAHWQNVFACQNCYCDRFPLCIGCSKCPSAPPKPAPKPIAPVMPKLPTGTLPLWQQLQQISACSYCYCNAFPVCRGCLACLTNATNNTENAAAEEEGSGTPAKEEAVEAEEPEVEGPPLETPVEEAAAETATLKPAAPLPIIPSVVLKPEWTLQQRLIQTYSCSNCYCNAFPMCRGCLACLPEGAEGDGNETVTETAPATQPPAAASGNGCGCDCNQIPIQSGYNWCQSCCAVIRQPYQPLYLRSFGWLNPFWKKK